MDTIKAYYRLAKPGIIYGNLLSALAGFLLASGRNFHPALLLAMVFGLASIIGASCVGNNVMDRRIDQLMARTRKRALVTGNISARNALLYCVLLYALGILILRIWVNLLTLNVALFGSFAYLLLYGLGKRKTVHGTLIGSISGAVPPVVGYTAVTGRLDVAALLLFLVLVFWQMPHFYAIALFRSEDYRAAGIPVLPVVTGVKATKIQIMCYIIAYAISTTLLTFYGYTGIIYLLGVLLISIYWFSKGYTKYQLPPEKWGRMMFGTSLIALLAWCALTALSPWLP